jgi:8-oxo-dGTP diphosphatase
MTRVAVAILKRNGKILACQRKTGSRYGLKWEFPGGKLEEGESVESCLLRELREELGIVPIAVDKVEIQRSHYDDGGLFEVSYCHVSHFEGEPANKVFESISWVTPARLQQLDILEGNRDIVRRLAREVQ